MNTDGHRFDLPAGKSARVTETLADLYPSVFIHVHLWFSSPGGGQCTQRGAKPGVELVHPWRRRLVVGGQSGAPEIDRADDDHGLLPARIGSQDEQLLGG